MTASTKFRWADALILTSLWTMAVAQPIFTGLFKDGSFFSEGEYSFLGAVGVICSIAWLPPVLVSLLLWGLSRYFPKAAQFLLYVCVALLIAALAMLGLRPIYQLDLLFQIGFSFLIGIAVAIAASRVSLLHQFLYFLSPAILVFPILCAVDAQPAFNHPSLPGVVAKQDGAKTPVLMIVLDEFPLLSLLDKDGNIDAKHYPNFAELAESTHWFENAVTVHNSTGEAVPSILTGKYPPRTSPTTCQVSPLKDKPNDNLFTMLAPYYHIRAGESFIKMCSDNICESSAKPAAPLNLFNAIRVMSRQYVFDLLMNHPQWDWFYFKLRQLRNANVLAEGTHDGDLALFQQTEENMTKARPKNTLYFLHPLLPHINWEFTPTGKVYSNWPMMGRSIESCKRFQSDPFCSNPWRSRTLQQRLQLQIAFTDSLVGRLIAKLKRERLYDDALIVVTADHGVSTRPGIPLRDVTPNNIEDLQLIPLFVKLPHQQSGVRHSMIVENINILPTISETLKIKTPWKTDGVSLLDPQLHEKALYGICNPRQLMTITPDDLRKRKAQDIAQNALSEPYNLSPHPHLIGMPIPSQTGLAASYKIKRYTHDAHWFGKVIGDPTDTPKTIVMASNNKIIAATETYHPFNSYPFSIHEEFVSFLVPETDTQKPVSLYELREDHRKWDFHPIQLN